MKKNETFKPIKWNRLLRSVTRPERKENVTLDCTEKEMVQYYHVHLPGLPPSEVERMSRVLVGIKDNIAIHNGFYDSRVVHYAFTKQEILNLIRWSSNLSTVARGLNVSVISLRRFLEGEEEVNEITRHTILLALTKHLNGTSIIPHFTDTQLIDYVKWFRMRSEEVMYRMADEYNLPARTLRLIYNGNLNSFLSQRDRFQFCRAVEHFSTTEDIVM